MTFFLIVGLLGCGSLGKFGMNAIGTNITPIRQLKLKQDNQTTVYIQGKVEKRIPLVKQQAYQIDDSSGKIWVVTNQTGLREGDKVVIKGKLRYESIPIAGNEYGEVYLEEE
ncbi:MAG: hypothetical protein SAK29_25645 [Scytonema sp. PMC 1069.18]|nr:hypothetical protein [Scytonema sp. PMC 1069.18]MEC4880981.1 hypothetical protein [Scytonema sp. PMC 1070.18]